MDTPPATHPDDGLAAASLFPPDMLEQLRAAFNAADHDKSQTLDRDELSVLLQSLGSEEHKTTLDSLMTGMDKNGDGKVDFEEFLVAVARMSTGGGGHPDLDESSVLSDGSGESHDVLETGSDAGNRSATHLFPPEVVEQLRHAFQAADTDGSGSIERGEMARLLRELGSDDDAVALDAFMRKLDTDGDGTVSFDELLRAMATISTGRARASSSSTSIASARAELPALTLELTPSGALTNETMQRLRAMFVAADTDGSGYIERRELARLLIQLGEEKYGAELDAYLTEVDRDGDGRISFEDFSIAMAKRAGLRTPAAPAPLPLPVTNSQSGDSLHGSDTGDAFEQLQHLKMELRKALERESQLRTALQTADRTCRDAQSRTDALESDLQQERAGRRRDASEAKGKSDKLSEQIRDMERAAERDALMVTKSKSAHALEQAETRTLNDLLRAEEEKAAALAKQVEELIVNRTEARELRTQLNALSRKEEDATTRIATLEKELAAVSVSDRDKDAVIRRLRDEADTQRIEMDNKLVELARLRRLVDKTGPTEEEIAAVEANNAKLQELSTKLATREAEVTQLRDVEIVEVRKVASAHAAEVERLTQEVAQVRVQVLESEKTASALREQAVQLTTGKEQAEARERALVATQAEAAQTTKAQLEEKDRTIAAVRVAVERAQREQAAMEVKYERERTAGEQREPAFTALITSMDEALSRAMQAASLAGTPMSLVSPRTSGPELSGVEGQVVQRVQRLMQATESLQTIANDLKTAKEKNRELDAQLKAAIASNTTHEDAVREAGNLVANERSALANLESAYKALESDLQQQHSQTIAELMEKLQRLSVAKDEEAARRRADATEAALERTQWEQELAALKAQLARSNESLEKSQSSLAAAEARAPELAAKQASETAAWDEQREAMSKEINSGKAALTAAQELLKKRVRELQADLASSSSSTAELQGKVESLTAERERLSGEVERLTVVETRLAELQRNGTNVESALQTTRAQAAADRTKLEETVARLTTELKLAQDEGKLANSRCDQLASKLRISQEESANKDGALIAAKGEAARWKAQVADANARLATKSPEVSSPSLPVPERAALRKQLSNMSMENSKTRQELATASTVKANQDKQMAELRADNEAQRRAVADAQARWQEERVAREAVEAKFASAERTVRDLEHRIQTDERALSSDGHQPNIALLEVQALLALEKERSSKAQTETAELRKQQFVLQQDLEAARNGVDARVEELRIQLVAAQEAARGDLQKAQREAAASAASARDAQVAVELRAAAAQKELEGNRATYESVVGTNTVLQEQTRRLQEDVRGLSERIKGYEAADAGRAAQELAQRVLIERLIQEVGGLSSQLTGRLGMAVRPERLVTASRTR